MEKVNLRIISLSECRRRLKSIIHVSNVCAEGIQKGQCSGDSGGPLLYKNKQIALVSWSLKPCATQPGIFTNLSFYSKWIEQVISQYCKNIQFNKCTLF